MKALKKLWEAISDKKYLSLSSSLVPFLILPPFISELPILKYVILILYSIIILYCILIITGHSKVNVFHVVFLIAMIMTWINSSNPIFLITYYLLGILIFGATAAKIITQLIKIEKVDEKALLAALGGYLLIGLSGSFLVALVATIDNNAFNIPDVYDSEYNYVYFSFVTLTTLGYGDISPVIPIARFLVYMEAIVGVFYMAILVASIIGIRISDLHSDHD